MAGKKGRSGRRPGSTKLAKLREVTAYQGLLDFLDEMELRYWAIQKARDEGDYAAVFNMVEKLADRAKGKPAQQHNLAGPGGRVVSVMLGFGGHGMIIPTGGPNEG
jgi:hypothetical protein